MVPFSVLDLSPIVEGGSAADAFRNSLDLAQHAERWGYHRFWLAEHHNMPGIASAATAVLIGHIAGGTTTIRVGAGGIMLPNHSPLVIAEQFGTLESLYPGRIDLGLGRAPGTDGRTALALRRDLDTAGDRFPRDVMELQAYFAPVQPGQAIRAVPGAGLERAVVAPRVESLQRAARRRARPAVRLCLAFRARLPAAGARGLPAGVPAVGSAPRAPCHGRRERLRRRQRRGGPASVHVGPASVRQPAAWHAGSAGSRRWTRWKADGRRRRKRGSIMRWRMPP